MDDISLVKNRNLDGGGVVAKQDAELLGPNLKRWIMMI